METPLSGQLTWFIDELESLIDILGIQEKGFDFLGHSWGGMLGGVWAARHPKGLRKLILSNSPASCLLMLEGLRELLKGMPKDVQDALHDADRTGDYESNKYKEAVMEFYKEHVCRLEEWPPEVLATFANLEEDPTVYKTM